MRKVRLSRFGTLLASVYAVPSLFCLFVALTGTGDNKGNFVLLQLPIALQGAALQSIGFGSLLSGLHWPAAYLLIALPTTLALYGAGVVAGALFAAESGKPPGSNNAA